MIRSMSKTQNGFVVISDAGNILCTNGEWYSPRFVGPTGYSAKVWQTQAGAERARVRLGRGGRVESAR